MTTVRWASRGGDHPGLESGVKWSGVKEERFKRWQPAGSSCQLSHTTCPCQSMDWHPRGRELWGQDPWLWAFSILNFHIFWHTAGCNWYANWHSRWNGRNICDRQLLLRKGKAEIMISQQGAGLNRTDFLLFYSIKVELSLFYDYLSFNLVIVSQYK